MAQQTWDDYQHYLGGAYGGGNSNTPAGSTLPGAPAPVAPPPMTLGGTPAPSTGGAASTEPQIPAYSSPSYGGPMSPTYNFSAAPQFHYDAFKAPTMQEALNDPGYQFRLSSGADTMEHSAAARGVLRSGGTLQDLQRYGQDYATQEYGNVYDRNLKAWQANLGGAQAAFQPQYDEWKTLNSAEQKRAMAEFQRYLDVWQGNMSNAQNFNNNLTNVGLAYANNAGPTNQ